MRDFDADRKLCEQGTPGEWEAQVADLTNALEMAINQESIT